MTGYINFKLPFTVKKKKNYYVSYCPLIDLYSQGETKNIAIKNLADAISLFLLSCIERGTLDKVLSRCGAKIVKKVKKIPPKQNYINIPFPIQAESPQRACHA